MTVWRAEIERYLDDTRCPGTLTIYRGGEVMDTFDVYTDSGGPPDPTAYGGPTPPIVWQMTERIDEHPGRKQAFPHARIVPMDLADAKDRYPRRTFEGPDFFMTHFMGRSTGCFGPWEREQWGDYVDGMNEAFDEGGPFPITVVEMV